MALINGFLPVEDIRDIFRQGGNLMSAVTVSVLALTGAGQWSVPMMKLPKDRLLGAFCCRLTGMSDISIFLCASLVNRGL